MATGEPRWWPVGSIVYEPYVTYTPVIVPRPQPMPRGWECPKCGAVMAPKTLACLYCKPKDRAAAINAWIDQQRPVAPTDDQEAR